MSIGVQDRDEIFVGKSIFHWNFYLIFLPFLRNIYVILCTISESFNIYFSMKKTLYLFLMKYIVSMLLCRLFRKIDIDISNKNVNLFFSPFKKYLCFFAKCFEKLT